MLDFFGIPSPVGDNRGDFPDFSAGLSPWGMSGSICRMTLCSPGDIARLDPDGLDKVCCVFGRDLKLPTNIAHLAVDIRRGHDLDVGRDTPPRFSCHAGYRYRLTWC